MIRKEKAFGGMVGRRGGAQVNERQREAGSEFLIFFKFLIGFWASVASN